MHSLNTQLYNHIELPIEGYSPDRHAITSTYFPVFPSPLSPYIKLPVGDCLSGAGVYFAIYVGRRA